MKPLPAIAIAACGPPPAPDTELAWVPVAKLFADPRYQREIGPAGLAHARRIAEGFDWTKFSPLIVAPVECGFAIIDGQHRATAAKARGIAAVPAYVVKLAPADQAAAFAAINGAVTPMSSLHVFKAARAAGEGWAAVIDRVAEAAGITVLVYPKPIQTIGAFETMAVAAIRKGIARHGTGIVAIALKALSSHRDAGARLLNQHMVKAMIAFAALRCDRDNVAPFERLVAALPLAQLLRQSASDAPDAGMSRAAWLALAFEDAARERGEAKQASGGGVGFNAAIMRAL